MLKRGKWLGNTVLITHQTQSESCGMGGFLQGIWVSRSRKRKRGTSSQLHGVDARFRLDLGCGKRFLLVRPIKVLSLFFTLS